MNDNINQQVAKEGLEHKSNAATWIISSVIIILLLAWFVPPLVAETYLSKNIDKFLNAESINDVSVKSNTLQLLTGKFKSFSISGNNLKIGNLKVENYYLEASEGQIDLMKTLKDRNIALKESPVITLNLGISIDDMTELLQSFYKSLSKATIVGRDGYLEVSGVSATQDGLNLPIRFKLKLANNDWSSIQATPYDMEILSDKDIKDSVIDELTRIYTKTILFDNTTPPIYINSITVSENEVLITSNSALN